MREFNLGRLNGRYVVSWWEGTGPDRKRRRYRLEALTLGDAQREALDVIRQKTVKGEDATVESLWTAYRAEKEGRRVSAAMAFEWKSIGPHFGYLRPDQITTEICRDYTATRRKSGIQDGTIWTELGHLRSVMNWAEGHGLIKRAPRIERPSKPAPKDRWLTRQEVARLLAASTGHIRLAVLLMLSTAGRIGAILELTWDRVDFDNGIVNLRTGDTTTRKGRAVVPMNAGLRAALQEAREHAITNNVVEWNGEPVKSIKVGFAAAVERAGLDDVTPHTLRHTAAVHLAAAGVPMQKISQYLGHSNTAVTERVYARFAPDHLRDEASMLDFTGSLNP